MSNNHVRSSMNRTVRRMLRAALPALLLAGWAAGQAAEPPPALPAGALVVAETPDFKGLKAAWDGSAARPAWEASAALEMFKRSRLFLKLEDRRSLLSLAAGTELDEAFLDGLQAGRTIAAVYDPGRREALLMVELAHGGGGEALAALLKALPEQRHLGLAYRGRYLEEENVYLGAFQAGNRVYLASSERLIKEVVRVSKEGGGYRLPEFPAGAASLRLDVDLAAIRRTSYFRRYWLPLDRSAWAPYARELVALASTPAGWSEQRLFLESAETTAAWPAAPAFPAGPAGDAWPAWMVQQGVEAGPVKELLLGGILRLPAERRGELQPKELYSAAATGESAAEASDLEVRVDQPPPATDKEQLFAGAAAPGDELQAFLEKAGPWTVRWCWDLRRDAATGNWTRQEFGLSLESATAGADAGEQLKKLLGRALVAAYLCNPESVAWNGPAAGGTVAHCTAPVELLLDAPGPGTVLLATSAAQLARVRALAAVTVAAPLAGRLALGTAAGKYSQFLRDLGRADKPQAAYEPRFMEDVVPSLLQVLGRVSEIRILRAPVSGGMYERVEYVLAK